MSGAGDVSECSCPSKPSRLTFAHRLLITGILCVDKPDFSSRNILMTHYESAHYACGGCNVVYRTHYRLQDHQDEAHYMCHECEEFFENENNLRML